MLLSEKPIPHVRGIELDYQRLSRLSRRVMNRCCTLRTCFMRLFAPLPIKQEARTIPRMKVTVLMVETRMRVMMWSFQTEGFHNTPRFSRGSQMEGQSDPKYRQDNKTHHKPRLDEYSDTDRYDDKYARDEECAYSCKSPVIHSTS
nr:MAG TPA: hypothetical protein [Caudoviricetes sp.]